MTEKRMFACHHAEAERISLVENSAHAVRVEVGLLYNRRDWRDGWKQAKRGGWRLLLSSSRWSHPPMTNLPDDIVQEARRIAELLIGVYALPGEIDIIATALLSQQQKTARACVEWHLSQADGSREQPKHPELDHEAQTRFHECSARLLGHRFGLDVDAISRAFLPSQEQEG